jgi:hypothetical protein
MRVLINDQRQYVPLIDERDPHRAARAPRRLLIELTADGVDYRSLGDFAPDPFDRRLRHRLRMPHPFTLDGPCVQGSVRHSP